MKKLILAVALTLVGSSAWANDRHYRHHHRPHVQHHHHHNHYRWVAPVIIGGAIGYGLSQPRYYSPPTVYYAPQPNYHYVPPAYTSVPYGYREEVRFDAYCNCDRLVLVRE
jgi:hypothetical protein